MELQFITNQTDRYTYVEGAMMALEGGCLWIQLRMKEASDEELERTARYPKYQCMVRGAMLIIDDNVEVAKKVGADGVHLGKHDMPIEEARRILGTNAIIGGTANTFEDVKARVAAGADYVGCGPFRFTTTKKNLSPMLGLEGYREIIRKMKEEDIRVPIIAVGGVTRKDIPDLLATGVRGFALSGSILQAENPTAETRAIVNQMLERRRN